MKKTTLSVVTAGMLCVGMFSASAWAESESGNEERSSAQKELVIGTDSFSGQFNPFFAENTADQMILELTQTPIFISDRSGSLVLNGIEGEDREYEEKEYHYEGISDVTVERDENTTVCSIRLRDDIFFSDGTPITADDLIFTYYVYCDADYDGSATLYAADIQGLEAYRMNNSYVMAVSDDEVDKVIGQMPEQLEVEIRDVVMRGLLEEEYEWADGAWEDYARDYGLENADQFFALCYSVDDDYTTEGKDKEKILDDIAAMYGSDYKALATAYGDETYLDDPVRQAAREYMAENADADAMVKVDRISGIVKVSDHEVSITMDGYDASQIAKLGVNILPLHYYGDAAAYDYDANSFGFTRGDLSSIREKNDQLVGAGPYCFESYQDGIVTLSANKKYWKGEPQIDTIRCVPRDEAGKVAGIKDGTLDLAVTAGSKEASSIGSDNIVTLMTNNLGFGYIGINAEKVCVGGKPGSEQSKAYRKALATLIAVYRNSAVSAYYGDSARVINYQVSAASDVAPNRNQEDYTYAFSQNLKGEPIYTESMTAQECQEAAMKAALEYFEAAGFTVKEGKLTAAPDGAQLTCTAIVPAGGIGMHPCYKLLTDVSEALDKVGYTLVIKDIVDGNELWNARNDGNAQIWAAAWVQTSDPDLYQMYHSESSGSNYYHIADEKLDALIMQTRSKMDQAERKETYKKCFERIRSWAVEIPIYQRKNCIIYNRSVIDRDSFTKGITEYYGWIRDIEKIRLREE